MLHLIWDSTRNTSRCLSEWHLKPLGVSQEEGTRKQEVLRRRPLGNKPFSPGAHFALLNKLV